MGKVDVCFAGNGEALWDPTLLQVVKIVAVVDAGTVDKIRVEL